MKKELLILAPLVMLAMIQPGHPYRLSRAMAAETVKLVGIQAPARVVRDSDYIPHIYARNDHDAYQVLGYIHAQDRFFQMDVQRRTFSGQLAELLGNSALNSDIRLRNYGIRRAAEASLNSYRAETRAIFSAYADGVNAFLAEVKKSKDKLPPEYESLELTAASIPDWTPLDTVTIAKGVAFQFSFELLDLVLTRALAAFEKAGKAGGFDGRKLFFDDLYRFASFDTGVTVPAQQSSMAPTRKAPEGSNRAARHAAPAIGPETLELATKYVEDAQRIPSLRQFLERIDSPVGSNWWVISGKHTASGNPMLANDPHLQLGMAPIFYEVHITVEDDPKLGAMNVSGVSLAGLPSIVSGCNERLCWGASVNPMDVTDIYQEQLVEDSKTVFGATIFEGKKEPLVVIEQKYKVNKPGDGVIDNVGPHNVNPTEGGLTWVVPRRNNGPIIEFKRAGLVTVGFSVQYTGWGPTHELESFIRWARARNVGDFEKGLQFYEVGAQNWTVADAEGNIAYFTGAQAPLREDLQNLGAPDGNVPPFLVRDGTHKLKHEWLRAQDSGPGLPYKFQTVPFDEMPRSINPKQGFIANANNDPVGMTIDNDVMNQLRKGGGVYYLNMAYHTGIRMGRIVSMIEDAISKGRKISLDDMKRMQADNKMRDAEILVPHIVKAFENGRGQNAPAALVSLAQRPGIVEAVGRLRDWDFSTPTGIADGYDPGDDPDRKPEPSPREIQSSVSATIYALWRSRVIDNVIDSKLRGLGLAEFRPGNGASMSALRHLLDNFKKNQGKGASGVDFFDLKNGTPPEAARDIVILQSLQEALDALAGNQFADAFNRSTKQNDYRWGLLHRIVLNHGVGQKFSVPGTRSSHSPSPVAGNGAPREGWDVAGVIGFSHLSEELPGIPRSGGFETVDASGHSVRAASLDSFMFATGPARRFVGEVTPQGPNAFQILPGGESGDVRSRYYSNMLGRWLTNQYHPMLLTLGQVSANATSEQRFDPAR